MVMGTLHEALRPAPSVAVKRTTYPPALSPVKSVVGPVMVESAAFDPGGDAVIAHTSLTMRERASAVAVARSEARTPAVVATAGLHSTRGGVHPIGSPHESITGTSGTSGTSAGGTSGTRSPVFAPQAASAKLATIHEAEVRRDTRRAEPPLGVRVPLRGRDEKRLPARQRQRV
jgi:hypothetical protein